jgi:branched-chain amino acid transport system substrate-binding protein
MRFRSAWLAVSLHFLFSTSSVYAQALRRIGVIAPLSGTAASWGNDVRKVLTYANTELFSKEVELIFEDDGCLGQRAVTALHKLIDIDHIDAAMVVCTESVLATAPIFEQKKIIVIAPAASGASISQAGDYIFRTWPSDAAAARLLVQDLSQYFQKVALLSEERGFPEELTQAFLSASSGTLEVTTERFMSEATDFRTLLLRLRASQAKALFINVNGEATFATIVKQLKSIQWQPHIYGVYLPGNKAFRELAGSLAEGITFVDSPGAENLTTEGRELYANYVKHFGTLESSPFVFPAAIEALRLLVPKESSATTKDRLYHTTFKGIFGSFSFDRYGDLVGPRHVLKTIGHLK